MNKQQLANKIWESANKMRSKIEANEYKDYILGFIFYKYLSEKELKFLKKNGFNDETIKEYLKEDNSDIKEYVQTNLGYFIEYKNLFSTWLNKGKDFDVSDVNDGLGAFERLTDKAHEKVFHNIFLVLQTGLSKLGDDSKKQTKAISDLLQLIRDIPMSSDRKQDYDVLGFIYEYLISQFAANAGKKAGEFYTPHEVSVLISEIVAEHLKNKQEIKIYDPTSGSGSLLINIGHSAAKYTNFDSIKYYAQELKENTYNLTRMNLIMRDIKPDNIETRNADTLADDWPIDNDNPLYVDAVVSNPPYSQHWDSDNKETDPRYMRFGLAPKSKADYAFLLHDLYHLKPDGIMAIILPHGVLFRGNEEGQIRKNLIENNHIDTIIGLPANIFFGTGIPTIIMLLKQKRENTDVLIIDASKGFIKEGKNNKLRACDIKKIVDTVKERKDIPQYAKVVTREEIRQNDYNLNIPRYVDSSEKVESYDIYATMFGGIPCSEIDELSEYWSAFPNLKSCLFAESDIPYSRLQVEDVKSAVAGHADIITFKSNFDNAFHDFRSYLKDELINRIDTDEEISISQKEIDISEDIFNRLQNIPLVDKYNAYQLFYDEWVNIAVDLEIISSEKFEAVKKVDPNMVIKKKNNKEVEVQDGYVGHILPFELMQKMLLADDYNALRKKEERLIEISAGYEEILDSLTEEQKDNPAIKEKNDGFILKELKKQIKELAGDDSEETIDFIQKLEKAQSLMQEEKTLNTAVKKEKAELHKKTKETIENLTDEQAKQLLEKKWIDAVIANLNKLSDNVIDTLIKQIQELNAKYETTYFDIEKDIQATQKTLCSMIDELDGDEFDIKGLNEFKSLLMED